MRHERVGGASVVGGKRDPKIACPQISRCPMCTIGGMSGRRMRGLQRHPAPSTAFEVRPPRTSTLAGESPGAVRL